MLYHLDEAIARRQVGGRPEPRRASMFDDLVIEALQPVDILQIGMPGQLLERSLGAVVRRTGSLHEALSAMAEHEFDAILLGSGLADAWPTAAYERIAEVAGSRPVLVQVDAIWPMASIKQRQGREQDVIVATEKPSLLTRLILAAILRSRALAEEPGTQIG